jgi:hypothetical protein
LAHHHLQQNVAAGNVIARAATKPVGSISPNGGRQPTGAVTSRPPIYYAIQEDGQHRSYLGNQGGLLARSNFDKRQILIEQNGISTPHAVIRFLDKDTVTVRDLNSLEGTYVLTEKLTPGQAKTVLDGQPLQFGGGVRFALDMQNRMLKSRTPGVSD